MTVIVVAGSRILVDSGMTHGTCFYQCTKVERLPHFKYAGAGTSGELDSLARFVDCNWTPLGPPVVGPPWEINVAMVMRTPDGAVWALDATTHGLAVHLPVKKGQPFSYLTGSGASFFEAYYAQTKDVDAAFALTCLHEPNCSMPMEEF